MLVRKTAATEQRLMGFLRSGARNCAYVRTSRSSIFLPHASHRSLSRGVEPSRRRSCSSHRPSQGLLDANSGPVAAASLRHPVTYIRACSHNSRQDSWLRRTQSELCFADAPKHERARLGRSRESTQVEGGGGAWGAQVGSERD